LSSRLGLPKTLGEMGVTSSHVPAIARAAVEDHSHATNARPATVEDYERMLSEAIG
jgi:4-hydroxybutyrate dehydrogenase